MKILNLLVLSLLLACSSKPKIKTNTVNINLGSDGFTTVSMNVIEIKKEKSTEYVINGVLLYEAPGKAEIKLDANKPMIVAIDKEAVTLTPIKDKYRYTNKKTSSGGARVLHIQSNDYQVTKEILDRISEAKSVVVRIPAVPHKDGGFDGFFRRENKNQLIEFLN